MTQEEKAKAYDEAIERAKKMFSDKEIVYLFPELKESEDERIRKALLNDFKNNCSEYFCADINRDMVIAWLEKQGEQKPADKSKIKPKFKTGDRVIGIVSGMPYFITEVCDDHYNTESGCIIMFCSQDNFELYEQKSSWSAEDERIHNSIMYSFAHNYPLTVQQQEFVKSLKDKVQPQQEWSDVDKDILFRIIDDLKFLDSVNIIDVEREINWLKSLENRVQTQQKEWSEEDETVLNNLIYALANDRIGNNRDEYVDWLKSLRPQTTWKPSDIQMRILSIYTDQNNTHSSVLASLYNDLKKLREE